MDTKTSPFRTVAELARYDFFIPAYQRGYRWTNGEVRDLLEDIHSFTPREIPGSDRKTWYCLQPLVVKQKEHKQYEVIDGQQRLTTLLLVSRYINEMWGAREEDPVFGLAYESRESTGAFLSNLKVEADGHVLLDHSNIDFSHVSQAYRTIHEWVKSQSNFKKYQFIGTFRDHVRVIWYEPRDLDCIQVFTRLNVGKIPLTNAELIKALFLNNSNFGTNLSNSEETEKTRLKQLEIAGEWDRMEAAFHNPEFWYFLNQMDGETETRIDLVFSILTRVEPGLDPYAVFRAFQNDFPSSVDESLIDKKWTEVKHCFQTLEEWFLDRIYYHKIGYLIAVGEDLLELFYSARGKRKSAFLIELNRRIGATLPRSLEDIEYGSAGVRKVLLLHNVQTMLNNKEERSRFPFDRYKDEQWDVEHVHSVSEEMPKSDKHRRDWLEDAVQFIKEEELKQEIATRILVKSGSLQEFEILFERVLASLADKETVDDINGISNLVLLDSRTNRGYGNAVFPVKRQWIIKKERSGTFVPVATKNVFMKLYSKDIKNFTFWSSSDREDYFEDVSKIIAEYQETPTDGQ